MLLSAAILVAATALVTADVQHGDPHGGGSKGLVKHFDNLVTFGDSYTDEGLLGYFIDNKGVARPPGTALPASTNTAGGGITWPRWVSKYTGAKLYDYAVGGAVCDNKIIYRYFANIFGPFPDVVSEINAFIADTNYINKSTHTNTFFTNRREDNTVYSIWIGTNDLGNGAFLTDSSLHETTIPDYVDCVYDKLDVIYKAGGRNFVLMNTAPLQLLPQYGMPGAGGLPSTTYWSDKPANISEVSGKMKEYTKMVNQIYSYRTPYEFLIARRYPGASIAVFDTNSLLTDIYNHPTRYFDPPANVTGSYKILGVPQPGKPSQYMWFDELHPSERTDEFIAKEFVQVVKGTSKYATYW